MHETMCANVTFQFRFFCHAPRKFQVERATFPIQQMSSSASQTASSGSEDEREFYLEAVLLVTGLIVALLMSIFVSYHRWFRHVREISLTLTCFLSSRSLFLTLSQWMHESLAILILGTAIGALQYFVVSHTRYAGMLELFGPGSFSRIFYGVLFPPVVFNAGFTLKQRNFMKNIGSISVLAFIGTTIQSVITGALLYLAGSQLGYGSADPIECVVYGALLSATDTVATMATLIELNVQPLLHALVLCVIFICHSHSSHLYVRTHSI